MASSNYNNDDDMLMSHPHPHPHPSSLLPLPSHYQHNHTLHLDMASSSSPSPSRPLPHHHPSSTYRPSSSWSPQEDQALIDARARGLNWQPISETYFPNKTPNACRKRHERLMERRNAEDWDGVRLEALAQAYQQVRREMWTILGNQLGEKWSVVEAKACFFFLFLAACVCVWESM